MKIVSFQNNGTCLNVRKEHNANTIHHRREGVLQLCFSDPSQNPSQSSPQM